MLKKHMFVCGVPGAGKTNTMLRIATSLWKEHQIPFLLWQDIQALFPYPGRGRI